MALHDYILSLPYFKQGDDAFICQRTVASRITGKQPYELTPEELYSAPAADVFMEHARMLTDAVNILRRMSSEAKEHDIRIRDASTHLIALDLDEETAERLMGDGLIEDTCDDEPCEIEAPEFGHFDLY